MLISLIGYIHLIPTFGLLQLTNNTDIKFNLVMTTAIQIKVLHLIINYLVLKFISRILNDSDHPLNTKIRSDSVLNRTTIKFYENFCPVLHR